MQNSNFFIFMKFIPLTISVLKVIPALFVPRLTLPSWSCCRPCWWTVAAWCWVTTSASLSPTHSGSCGRYEH